MIEISKYTPVVIGDAALYLGDCLEIVPLLDPANVIITDPPYGCNKTEWDTFFPVEWYPMAKSKVDMVCIITGSAGLKDSVTLVGEDFVDVIAALSKNGRTRGPMGFINWLAVVVSCSKPKLGQNCFDFSVVGEKPDHPTVKPIQFMIRLIDRLTKEGDVVLDPFMGSGSTGVACLKQGRKFIGIEINEAYFETACKRIQLEYDQGKLFL